MKTKFYISKLLKALVLGLIFNLAFATPNKKEVKELSDFISVFTTINSHYYLGDIQQKNPDELLKVLLQFAVSHNSFGAKNNFIDEECPKKDDYYYGLKYESVAKPIEKFFGYKLKDFPKQSIDDIFLENNCYYYRDADGEITPNAKVQFVKKLDDNIILIQGILYFDEEVELDVKQGEFAGFFIAKVKQITYEGKKSYNLISIKFIG